MKAVILAAGEGIRLRPFTITRPKVMIPVANKPIMEYVISALSNSGIHNLIIVVGYKKESVMDYFEDGQDFGANIRYVEQAQQLGTANAIKRVSRYIDDKFLVLNGDNLIESSAILDLLEDGSANGTSILTVTKEQTEGYGVVKTDNGRITKIIEKPKHMVGNLVNTGIYLFSPSIFDEIDETSISERGEYDITDTLQQMIESGTKVSSVHTKSNWADAAYPWDLLVVNSSILGDIKGKNSGEIEEEVVIKGEVIIGEGCIIRSGSYIIGPVVIGRDCEIGPNVTITPSTSIGDGVFISPNSVIENSILMNDVKIGPNSCIFGSIIGENTTLGAGFVTEHIPSKAICADELISVDMGAVIGENCTIDCRTLTKTGCIVGVNCKVTSGKVISGNLPNNSIVI